MSIIFYIGTNALCYICSIQCVDSCNVTYENRTSYISFIGSGEVDKSNWHKTSFKFSNILSAISKSGLRDSLCTLQVTGCGFIYKKLAQKILDKHNLGYIEAI